jgi:hypothetical protein
LELILVAQGNVEHLAAVACRPPAGRPQPARQPAVHLKGCDEKLEMSRSLNHLFKQM